MSGIANRQRTEQQGKDPFSLFWSFPEMPRGLGTQIPLTLSGMLVRTRGDARPANIRGAQAVVFGLAQLCRPLLRRLATYSAQPRASLPACIPLGYSAADAMLNTAEIFPRTSGRIRAPLIPGRGLGKQSCT